jgi:hypothetical protein
LIVCIKWWYATNKHAHAVDFRFAPWKNKPTHVRIVFVWYDAWYWQLTLNLYCWC